MYPDVLRTQIDDLNGNLKSLNNSMNNFSNTSNELQNKLIFWTKIMALAVIIQAVAIGIQIYLTFLR